jgi:regulator of protease activity HflC (stomatin/prohibitin superfamily)
MTVLLLSSMLLSIVVVRPGEVAVVVTLGHIAVLPPGARLRIPFVSYVDRMSTKTQLMDQINTIPTKEGLTVQLEAAV